jgi:hypothetical protein
MVILQLLLRGRWGSQERCDPAVLFSNSRVMPCRCNVFRDSAVLTVVHGCVASHASGSTWNVVPGSAADKGSLYAGAAVSLSKWCCPNFGAVVVAMPWLGVWFRMRRTVRHRCFECNSVYLSFRVARLGC